MENNYYLTEYLGEYRAPLDCVIKRLYSDFVVNEITKSGKIIEVKYSIDESSGCILDKQEEIEEMPMPDGINEEKIALLDAVLSDQQKSVDLVVEGFDKDGRTRIHEWIRTKYDGKLDSQTCSNWITVTKATNSSRKRKHWPTERPNYLHFTLSKENKDTQYAISVIAKLLGMRCSSFGICGMKDRRALTSQRVSIYRCDALRLDALNIKLRGMRVSDLSYHWEPFKLGDLWGNRFKIVLRETQDHDENDIIERIEEFKHNGFINYFGTQRFGSCGVNTAEVGLALLKKQWQTAVNIILKPRNVKGMLKKALDIYDNTKDPLLALKKLSGRKVSTTIEAQLLHALAKSRGNYYDAMMSLPRNSRSLYMHAYQSLLWNKIASRRVRLWGRRVIDGDIDVEGNAIVDGGAVQEVALPLIAKYMVLPNNEIAKWYKEVMDEDGVTTNMFHALERQYAISAVLRPLFARPSNVVYRFLRYPDPNTKIQQDLDGNIDLGAIGSGDRRAIAIEFSLPSSTYATVALREVMRVDMGKMAQMTRAVPAAEGDCSDDDSKLESE